jgi:tetratricopeptide (TPR) repeat protein
MARGTQHLKKRPAAAAARPQQQRSRSEVRRTRRMEESGMFFPSLRRHARWVFVLLAVVFAAGFVLFGVGSGSNGIGNILQNWLNIGNGSGPSISKLEAKTKAHPTDAAAFRDLASAYEAKHETAQAATALRRYAALRPKDADALQELAGLYQQRLSELSSQYAAIQAAPVTGVSQFVPPATTPLGQALATDPVVQQVQTYVTAAQTRLSQQAQTLAKRTESTYGKIVSLDPTDATSTYQYAQAAQSAGDTTLAIAMYKKAAKLDPTSYGAASKQALKQLEPSPTTTTTPSPKRK